MHETSFSFSLQVHFWVGNLLIYQSGFESGKAVDFTSENVLYFSFWVSFLYTFNPFPMDTSSLIRHRFDVEIPRGKFVEITSILKGESTWKLWHRFDVEISTWIRLSKSKKYGWVFHVDFSTLFRRRIDVTSVLAVSIVLFPYIFCSGNLF